MNTVDLIFSDLKFEQHLARLAAAKQAERERRAVCSEVNSVPKKEAV